MVCVVELLQCVHRRSFRNNAGERCIRRTVVCSCCRVRALEQSEILSSLVQRAGESSLIRRVERTAAGIDEGQSRFFKRAQ